jgi:hypothetical protein
MNTYDLDDLAKHGGFRSEPLRTILNGLPPLGSNGPWLAGGSIRRLLSGQPLDSDLDIFFENYDQSSRFVSSMLSDGFERNGGVLADTFTNGALKVQVCRVSYYPSAESVIDSFDFTICQFLFDGLRLHVGEHALWDLARKRLAVNKITFPRSSARRMLKYASQGFLVSHQAIESILESVAESPNSLNKESPSPYGD